MNKKIFLEIDIFKTVMFNMKYVGIRSLFTLPILVSRNVMIRNLGGKVVIPQSSSRGHIHLGFHVVGIFDRKKERFIWDNRGTMVFRGGAFLGSGVRLSNEGILLFGEDVFVSANTSIVCNKEVMIGDRCNIAWNCLIMDTDFHQIVDRKTKEVLNLPESISIGDHVWICCNSTILKGSNIAEHVVVAAGSTVAKTLEKAYCIYKGNSCIKEGIDWKD